MFVTKKIPFFKGGLDYTHIVIAVLSSLLTISVAAGNYQNKIDTLIAENKEVKISMKELSIALTSLTIQVTALTQRLNDANLISPLLEHKNGQNFSYNGHIISPDYKK